MPDTQRVTPGRAARVNEMRIVLECPGPSAFIGVADVVDQAMAEWQVAPLATGQDQVWVVFGTVVERVGTADYARVAHTLVQRILDLTVGRHLPKSAPWNAFTGHFAASRVGAG
ncbi:hypothetical protein [Cryobacterium sp.]|jgi:hypothetical protein|uniref:hypothetical protein n=1 Tax=Cryobacterium sp. TaxID=1926290 RepID=UPI00262CA9CC|nr:hypothetical protein [Cryobacterium sp.]MCU1446671.1 Serine protease, in family [Cryobacterium sp.]